MKCGRHIPLWGWRIFLNICDEKEYICIPTIITSPCYTLPAWSGWHLKKNWYIVIYKSFSVLSFCLFILFMEFSRQLYWNGLPFHSPVDHILSDKDWCWSWNSNTLATWCEELTHWKRSWCWERLKVGGEGDDRGWDGWMASLTQWTWVWASSGSWWWTGKPGMLQSIGSQRVRHDWEAELNWTENSRNFSRGLVVETSSFHCRGCRLDPSLRNRTLHAARHGQKTNKTPQTKNHPSKTKQKSPKIKFQFPYSLFSWKEWTLFSKLISWHFPAGILFSNYRPSF